MVQRSVGERDTTLGNHLFQVTIANPVAAVLTHGPKHDLTPEMMALEVAHATTLILAMTHQMLAAEKVCNRPLSGIRPLFANLRARYLVSGTDQTIQIFPIVGFLKRFSMLTHLHVVDPAFLIGDLFGTAGLHALTHRERPHEVSRIQQ